jgi:hypothetical protein
MVVIHYATVCFFTKHWTWWQSLWYFVSVCLFCPFQVFTYDSMNGNALSRRLSEIAFSNWQFWATFSITVFICVVPIVFYYLSNALLFPSLKDLITLNQLDPSIVEEADPKRARAAMELMKKQQ